MTLQRFLLTVTVLFCLRAEESITQPDANSTAYASAESSTDEYSIYQVHNREILRSVNNETMVENTITYTKKITDRKNTLLKYVILM